jgi:hypothetical protein
MFVQSLFLTTLLFMALGVFLMGECQFLIPYRALLFQKYGASVLTFALVLYGNVLAGLATAGRRFFLKETGQKLAHVEKQLRTGSGFSDELSRRLED